MAVLSTLAIATRQVNQGRLSESHPCWCGAFTESSSERFVKKILGENDIEAVLQRLDRLTLDEARATGAQTLEVVYDLVQHRRVVLDGKETSPHHLRRMSMNDHSSRPRRQGDSRRYPDGSWSVL